MKMVMTMAPRTWVLDRGVGARELVGDSELCRRGLSKNGNGVELLVPQFADVRLDEGSEVGYGHAGVVCNHCEDAVLSGREQGCLQRII